MSLLARLAAGALRARFALSRAFLAWILSGAAIWLAASAGGPAPWWLGVLVAVSGFLLSFRFPETRVAPLFDALALGLWAIVTGSPVVAAASLVLPAIGRLADAKIFSNEPRQGRKG